MTSIRQRTYNPERQLYEYDILESAGGIVGFAQLRLIPSKSLDMPEGFESNIYYETNPDYQGKGHAMAALKLILKEASDKGLPQIIATVNADNAASKKVIEKCGGSLEAESRTAGGKKVLKYQFQIT